MNTKKPFFSAKIFLDFNEKISSRNWISMRNNMTGVFKTKCTPEGSDSNRFPLTITHTIFPFVSLSTIRIFTNYNTFYIINIFIYFTIINFSSYIIYSSPIIFTMNKSNNIIYFNTLISQYIISIIRYNIVLNIII